MTNNTMLITRPNHDPETCYLYRWSEDIINFAHSKNVDVFDLSDKKSNRSDFESYLNKRKPGLVIINGHGTETEILGQDNKVLIKADDNEDVLESKIVYSRTCASAKILGPKCIDSGTIAFIGYTGNFLFVFNSSKVSNPETDEIGNIFAKSTNIIPISLMKGNKVEDAVSKSVQIMKEQIDYYSANDTLESPTILFCLRRNLVHQIVHGDKQAIFN
ncbi:MAG: hypothetical protein KJ906_02465 [Nanoarchaeota archaeon]|nr:hypothetical protein [Nanoarchaeota archaeon]